MKMLHIKQNDADGSGNGSAWINTKYIVAIEPDEDGSVIITNAGRLALRYFTDEDPAGLLARLTNWKDRIEWKTE